MGRYGYYHSYPADSVNTAAIFRAQRPALYYIDTL